MDESLMKMHKNQGFIDKIDQKLKKVFKVLNERPRFASEIKNKMNSIFCKSMMMMCPKAQRIGMDWYEANAYRKASDLLRGFFLLCFQQKWFGTVKRGTEIIYPGETQKNQIRKSKE